MSMTRSDRLLLAGPLGLCLLLTGCFLQSAPDDEPAPDPSPTSTVAAGGDAVQDTWVYERVRTVAADGSLVDVTEDLLAGLEGDADAAVELVDGVTFSPVPALDAGIRDEAGVLREDLDVLAGLVETERGRALQVIATPTGDLSVGADDLMVMDLTHLGLDPGAPLVVDFAFGQGLPAEGDGGNDVSGAELLRDRMADDRFQWYAVEADGELAPGLLTVFGSVSGGAGSLPATGTVAGTSPAGVGGVFRARTAAAAAPTARIVPVGSGFGGGGIPSKADPVIDPVGDLATCTDGPIDCLSEYFKSQKKGSQKSLDQLFDDNMGCTGSCDPPPPCRWFCGGKSGEPHVKTFDGARYDLQLVGEFTLAATDGLTVQTRTAPYWSSTTVSVISAAAIEVDGHRLTAQIGRESVLWLDGEPVSLAKARDGLELGRSTAVVYGNTLFVETATGSVVEMHGLESGYLDVYVGPGDGSGPWSGLLGSPDGDHVNDLTTRDGAVLDAEYTIEQLYGKFGQSWRITDRTSLFDYADGESTATFTDLSFPSRHLTLDDLSADRRAVAETVCRLAGIQKISQLEDCVFDYAVTGDMAFVRTARHVNAVLDPGAHEWLTPVPGATGVAGEAVLDGVGHVLVPLATDDGGRVTALDLATGEVAWSIPTAAAGCVAVADGGDVVVPVSGEDGSIALGVIDPADGKQVADVPTALHRCDAMTAVGDVVVVRARGSLLGVDVALPEVRFELQFDGLQTDPVVSGDGGVWVVRNHDEGAVTAERIDPTSGESVVVQVPVHSALSTSAATADGVVLAYRGEQRDVGGLIRMTAAGPVWQTALPASFDGTVVDRIVSGPIAVGDGKVVAHLHSELVGAFDLATGDPLRTITPSSFANNGDQQAVVDGLVVVGPMGGKHWVETWDLDSGRPGWARNPSDLGATEDLGIHDVKRIGPRTPSGQVVVASSMRGGAVVALLGPGG